MTTIKVKKVRKYLFLVSVAIFVSSFFHLIYLYLYSDAEVIPVKWWTISEWLIWSFPSLNPLKNLSGNNQYIVSLLYRSLLRYDLEQWKIVWDLTNCDISNLKNIECYLNENVKWSDGTPITTEDIYTTYNTIKGQNTDIILTSLLSSTTIEYTDNIIRFKNNSEDVNFLNVFFQPIVAKKVLDNLSNLELSGNFPTSNWLYSWDFKITSVSSDLTLWVSKITLDKNEFHNTSNISRVVLNIFPSDSSFQKSGQFMNIFNDTNDIIWNTIPRLESYKYILPQFVGLFINENKISNVDLRTFIFNKINTENLLKLLGKDNFVLIDNPYLTETSISTEPNIKNFEAVMSTLWYYKKSKFIQDLLGSSSSIAKIPDAEELKTPEEMTIDDFQMKSEIITSPNYVEKYNFVKKDDILLQGKVDEGVDEVWINDYKLTGFRAWETIFSYRLRVSYDSIKEGRNDYKIYFVKNWEKELKEELVFLYYTNEATLEAEKQKLLRELYAAKLTLENANSTQIQDVNTSELDKLNKLDENTYYNNNLVPFTLSLYYPNSAKDVETTANFIKSSLKELWVNVELTPFILNDLKWILSNKDEYDMILTGINLGYFEFNIFPYFHSSQAKNGYNFSNIKKPSLDLLLEDLKSSLSKEEERKKLEEKVLDLLKTEQSIKTLYSPKNNLLVDKNLKIEQVYEKLPAKYLRSYILNSSYTKDEKVVNYENKSSFWWLKFIFKKLYE